VGKVDRAGGADDGDAGADEGRAQGFQVHVVSSCGGCGRFRVATEDRDGRLAFIRLD
jgi:hypothetical protein